MPDMANEIVNDDGCPCETCERARELTCKCLRLVNESDGSAVSWYMALISAGATVIANKLGPLDQLGAADSIRSVADRIAAHANKTLAAAGCVAVPMDEIGHEVADAQAPKSTRN